MRTLILVVLLSLVIGCPEHKTIVVCDEVKLGEYMKSCIDNQGASNGCMCGSNAVQAFCRETLVPEQILLERNDNGQVEGR